MQLKLIFINLLQMRKLVKELPPPPPLTPLPLDDDDPTPNANDLSNATSTAVGLQDSYPIKSVIEPRTIITEVTTVADNCHTVS